MDDDRIEAFDHHYRLTRDEIEAMGSGWEEIAAKERAIKHLVLASPRGVEELQRRLIEPDSKPTKDDASQLIWGLDREWAVNALAASGDSRAVPALCQLLEDHEYRVQKTAFEQLARLRDPRAVGPLIAALGNSWAASALADIALANDAVRREVVEALCRRITDLVAAAINPELQASLLANVRYVDFRKLLSPPVKALKELADPASIDALVVVLELTEVDRHVREEAAAALGGIADQRVVPPLVTALNDESAHVVYYAAHALLRVAEQRPDLLEVPQLEQLEAFFLADDGLYSAENAAKFRRLIEER